METGHKNADGLSRDQAERINVSIGELGVRTFSGTKPQLRFLDVVGET